MKRPAEMLLQALNRSERTDKLAKTLRQVLMEKELQKDVAKEHRISQNLVSILVRKVQKSPNMLSELVDNEKATYLRRSTIASTVREMNSQDSFIDSAASVKK